MQQKINFNINETVLVKLTEFGKEQLRKDHYEFWSKVNCKTIPEFILPKEDSFGYSKWHLWVLMQKLGKYFSLGGDLPFETEIIFIKENHDNT